MEARVGIEPTIAELQSTALPLCYRAFDLTFNYLFQISVSNICFKYLFQISVSNIFLYSLGLIGTAVQRPLF